MPGADPVSKVKAAIRIPRELGGPDHNSRIATADPRRLQSPKIGNATLHDAQVCKDALGRQWRDEDPALDTSPAPLRQREGIRDQVKSSGVAFHRTVSKIFSLSSSR